MIRRGLTACSSSQVSPQPRIARGVNDSVKMSAQRTRSSSSSRPAGLEGSIVVIALLAFMFWNSPEPSGLVESSLMNGCKVRAVSIRVLDSTRTVRTPKSASVRVPAGPAITHIRSTMFSPSSGGAESSPAPCRLGAGRVSASTSSVCSPSSGAGRRYSIGLPLSRANGPGKRSRLPPRSTSRQ